MPAGIARLVTTHMDLDAGRPLVVIVSGELRIARKSPAMGFATVWRNRGLPRRGRQVQRYEALTGRMETAEG